MRFMTLTTAKTQKRTLVRSFQVLRQRVMRATYEKDGFIGFKFNRYFCIRTSEGNGVLHVVFWGRFIPQTWLSRNWLDIHGAHRADIRACYTKRRKVNGLVGYLLTNYLQRQPIERMSYGWLWAWLGFCKSWQRVKQGYGQMRRGNGELTARIIHVKAHEALYTIRHTMSFKDYYSSHAVDAWHSLLWDHPFGSRQKKLTAFC